MAAAPMPQPQAAPPSAGQVAPQGGPAVLQLVALITRASQQLAQVFPAASEDADAIQQALQNVQQKMSATMSPSQPAAPPI